MSATDDLKQAFADWQRNARQAQIRFGTVKAVDWTEKTLTVTGTTDDLDYYDVPAGLGAVCIRPAIGSRVLIGIVEGMDAASFLVAAETAELIELNGGGNGGMVLATPLQQHFNAIEKQMNDLKNIFKGWTPAPNDGGAALKTALTAWMGTPLPETKAAELENSKITQ